MEYTITKDYPTKVGGRGDPLIDKMLDYLRQEGITAFAKTGTFQVPRIVGKMGGLEIEIFFQEMFPMRSVKSQMHTIIKLPKATGDEKTDNEIRANADTVLSSIARFPSNSE